MLTNTAGSASTHLERTAVTVAWSGACIGLAAAGISWISTGTVEGALIVVSLLTAAASVPLGRRRRASGR